MDGIFSAVFDNRRDAEAAMAALLQAGFGAGALRLATGDPTGADSPLTGQSLPAAPAAADSQGAVRAQGGVGHFLNTLFGTDNSEHVQRIDGAVTHSHQVLTLSVHGAAEAERAAAIVERFGPVEIDSGGIGGQASMARDGGAAPLSQLQAEPPGRAQAQGAASAAEMAEHEAAWRRHHAAYYAGKGATDTAGDSAAPFPGDEHYDEYAPAYLYGLDMATHEQHGGQEWQEAEAALRGEWERRHPQSAWTRFREAVRHGWERLRGAGK